MQFVLVLFEILTILSIIYLIAMENIFMCAMISGLCSVCITAIYCILNAPDIAITESAINIVVGPTIFILSILHLKDIYNNKNFSKIPQDITKKIFFIGLLFITIFFILNNTLSDLPKSSYFVKNTKMTISNYYINNTFKNFHFNGIVTAILAGYRAFDTLFETLVIFISSFGFYKILSKNEKL